MLNDTICLRHLSRRLGSSIYDALPKDYIMDILDEESLMTFSLYYPFLIKNIVIRRENGIEEMQANNGRTAIYKYKLPTIDPDSPYIGLEMHYYSGNNMMGNYTGLNPMPTDALAGKLMSYLPYPTIRYSVRFEAPDILIVDPPPSAHSDFAVVMQRVRKLYEIPLHYRELFLRLFVLDVKAAIYNEFKNSRDSTVFGGLEVNTGISDYSNAEDDRRAFLDDVLRKDSYKNSERFEAMMKGV